MLHVLHESGYKTAAAFGNQLDPSFRNLFVVHQDEEQVEQRHAKSQNGDNEIHGLRQQRPHLVDGHFQRLDDIVFLQQLDDGVLIDVLFQKIFYAFGDGGVAGVLKQVGDDRTEPHEFRYGRRYD